MSPRLPALLLAVLAATCLPAPARAASSYDSCTNFIDSIPVLISTQGTWCLRKDLSTNLTTGTAITVETNNVTIDCNGYKLGNLSAGTGTFTRGIEAGTRLNLTVRDCMIRGFNMGVMFYGDGSANHRIEHNQFDNNRVQAIFASGSGTVVRDNRIVDTGGSTASPGVAYAITLQYGANALDNTISGLQAEPVEGSAWVTAIVVNPNSNGSLVRGNLVRDLVPVGEGTSTAIDVYASGVQIRDNHIAGPITKAIVCTSPTAAAIGNFSTAVAVTVDGCTSFDHIDTD